MFFAPLFKLPKEVDQRDEFEQIEILEQRIKRQQRGTEVKLVKSYYAKITEEGAVLNEDDKLVLETIEIMREMPHLENYEQLSKDFDKTLVAAAMRDLKASQDQAAVNIKTLNKICGISDA